MSSLRQTFLEGLKDTYDAEQQIIKALPKMIKAAGHEKLKEAFKSHLEETHGHIERLETVFQRSGETAIRKKCKGMEGLLAESDELIAGQEGDAMLISAAQKVEHYEISAYGTLAAWAKLLEEDELVEILQETQSEEEAADEILTDIAETTINPHEAGKSERKTSSSTSAYRFNLR